MTGKTETLLKGLDDAATAIFIASAAGTDSLNSLAPAFDLMSPVASNCPKGPGEEAGGT